MHQRRRRTGEDNRLPGDIATIQALLLQRWWTLLDLADFLNLNIETVKFCVKVIGRQRYVFCRRTKLHYKPKEYRLLPEAVGVKAL